MEKQVTLTSYHLRVKGHIDERWLRWFESLTISQEPNGETVINGVMDQATLHGILKRVRDMGLELISAHQSSSVGNDTDKRKI